MSRFLIILFLFISFSATAQSYLGKNKEEIVNLTQSEFKNIKLTFDQISKDSACIKVVNRYETLYYFLIEDVCVEFMVVKPYNCNCLEKDIYNYDKHLISLGENTWMSKDMSTNYQMIFDEKEYAVSVARNHQTMVSHNYLNLSIFKR